MGRSKLVLTVLGAAAALAVAGCGSVAAADAGHVSGASGPAGAGSAASGGASASTSPASGGGAAASSGPVSRGGPVRPIGGVSGLLCSAPGAASQVVITRMGAGDPVLPSGPRVSAFLASGTVPSPHLVVKGAAAARELAKAICGLPFTAAGPLHCPRQTTASYRLSFTAGDRVVPAVLVEPSGCEMVTGAGAVRSAARSPAFLKLLASMAGPLPLPGPGHLPGTTVSGAQFRPLAARGQP
jgi:hypothetical protein